MLCFSPTIQGLAEPSRVLHGVPDERLRGRVLPSRVVPLLDLCEPPPPRHQLLGQHPRLLLRGREVQVSNLCASFLA